MLYRVLSLPCPGPWRGHAEQTTGKQTVAPSQQFPVPIAIPSCLCTLNFQCKMTFKHIRFWEGGLLSGYFTQGPYHALSHCTPVQIVSAELFFHILMPLIYMHTSFDPGQALYSPPPPVPKPQSICLQSGLIERWGKVDGVAPWRFLTTAGDKRGLCAQMYSQTSERAGFTGACRWALNYDKDCVSWAISNVLLFGVDQKCSVNRAAPTGSLINRDTAALLSILLSSPSHSLSLETHFQNRSIRPPVRPPGEREVPGTPFVFRRLLGKVREKKSLGKISSEKNSSTLRKPRQTPGTNVPTCL